MFFEAYLFNWISFFIYSGKRFLGINEEKLNIVVIVSISIKDRNG